MYTLDSSSKGINGGRNWGFFYPNVNLEHGDILPRQCTCGGMSHQPQKLAGHSEKNVLRLGWRNRQMFLLIIVCGGFLGAYPLRTGLGHEQVERMAITPSSSALHCSPKPPPSSSTPPILCAWRGTITQGVKGERTSGPGGSRMSRAYGQPSTGNSLHLSWSFQGLAVGHDILMLYPCLGLLSSCLLWYFFLPSQLDLPKFGSSKCFWICSGGVNSVWPEQSHLSRWTEWDFSEEIWTSVVWIPTVDIMIHTPMRMFM